MAADQYLGRRPSRVSQTSIVIGAVMPGGQRKDSKQEPIETILEMAEEDWKEAV